MLVIDGKIVGGKALADAKGEVQRGDRGPRADRVGHAVGRRVRVAEASGSRTEQNRHVAGSAGGHGKVNDIIQAVLEKREE